MATVKSSNKTIGIFAIVCTLVVFVVGIFHAKAIVAYKKHLDPEHRIEFSSGATPSNPLDFNRPYSQIAGYLYRPKGDGRFPAVVLLHPVDGIHRTQIEWAKRFTTWGYVAILVDSLDRSGSGLTGSPMTMAQDAYGAIKHLHSLAFVDSRRLAVIGWELGANAIMRGLKENPLNPGSPSTFFTKDPSYRFKAGIMYHPLCSPAETTLYAPLLIQMGEKDEYFPTGGCDAFPKENRAGGEPFRITVYPGATSFFDYGETGQDHNLNRFVPDPVATKDSITKIRVFLQEKL